MVAIKSASEAVATIQNKSSIMFGGFGRVGSPETLIQALCESKIAEITVIGNDLGSHNEGLGILLLQGKIKKAIGSFFTPNPDAAKLHQQGNLEVELIPQGNFAEGIRAAGAGLGGFLTPIGVGTKLAEGQQVVEFMGREYIIQPPISADVALIRAKKADTLGNLIYNKSGRNFNPLMASAAKFCIAEVDEIVETGELSPEEIITPFIYVDVLVKKGDLK